MPTAIPAFKLSSAAPETKPTSVGPAAQPTSPASAINANIAVPTGGTVGGISVALALNGEPLQTSRAMVTPAAVENWFNVTSTAIITVPAGCCTTVSVENTSEGADGTGVTIEVQNANLTVSRIA